MIYPSIAELSDEGVNRYMLSIATAKCARKITDEQLQAQGALPKDDKAPVFSAKKANSSEKPVKEAIERLHTRKFKVITE